MKNKSKEIDNMEMLDRKDGDRLAILVANVAKQLVRSGAEIYRAEDTGRRICARYKNIEYINIYATYNLVMVSFSLSGEEFSTMRTFHGVDYNLEKVAKINEFSRKFTSEGISIEEGLKIIENIYLEDNEKMLHMALFAAFGSAFLIVNFNGGIEDFIITLIAAFIGELSFIRISKRGIPIFINTIIGCLIASSICHIIMKLGLGTSIDIVVMGSIMPFLPGVSFTNSVRDFLSGEVESGLLALVQSLIIAAGMALGVSSTFLLFS